MPLREAAARQSVDGWAAAAEPAWSEAERDDLARALVALSAAVTPHVVRDADLSEEHEQRYLVARAEGELCDWLLRMAAGLRRVLGLNGPVLRADGSGPALGLRSAAHEELVALPRVGETRAVDIARMVALHRGVRSVRDLEAIDGVGDQTVAELERSTYLDEPVAVLASRTLIDFAHGPDLPSLVRLLDRSDLEVAFGDENTLRRRGPAGGSSVARLLRFLALARTTAERLQTPGSGRLASEAQRWLARHDLREERLGRMRPASGRLIVNEDYYDAALGLVENARESVRLMVFVGTLAAGNAGEPGPLGLVEALEARAAAGASVRVLLDQDDGGEPYKSYLINKPLLERLRDTEVEVRFDDEDTLLHSKLLVVDGEKAIVGSHNWTRAALNDSHEVGVLIESRELASAFAERFSEVWSGLA